MKPTVRPRLVAPPLDRHDSALSAVLIPHISSAPLSTTTVVEANVASPIAQYSRQDTSSSVAKEMGSDDYAASEHDELTREAQDLRLRVARLRAASDTEPSPIEPVQAPESADAPPEKEPRLAPSTSRPTTMTAGSLRMGFENEALRRELDLLRREMERLQAGIARDADDWGPPPAYASA